MLRRVLVVTAIVLAGCGTGAGTLPRLALLEPGEGFKMLRPRATIVECRGGAIWSPVGTPADDMIDRALRRLLESDPEADVVLNARLEWTSWTIGVYGRRCVTLTGDVVRSIRTVVLPMPGDHTGHTGHGAH